MIPIRKYAIILEHTPQDMVATVTNAIAKGWHPCGGVAVCHEPAKPNQGVVTPRLCFTQAMILPYKATDAYGLEKEAEDITRSILAEGLESAKAPAPALELNGGKRIVRK